MACKVDLVTKFNKYCLKYAKQPSRVQRMKEVCPTPKCAPSARWCVERSSLAIRSDALSATGALSLPRVANFLAVGIECNMSLISSAPQGGTIVEKGNNLSSIVKEHHSEETMDKELQNLNPVGSVGHMNFNNVNNDVLRYPRWNAQRL
ncbi:hypothetical protein Lal_00049343 [Lupinus albus]|nr:hypothetical protein Lal_00049343 [Lupinus albus]